MKKLLSLLLVAAMLLCWVPGPISADAAEDSQKLYLKPNSNWLEAMPALPSTIGMPAATHGRI